MWARNHYSKDKGFDYDILVYVASWSDDRISHWELVLPARAIENQSYVIGVNRCGIDKKGYTYKGASIAINYQGDTMVRATDDREEIIYATLDKEALNTYRDKFPVSLDWDE
jgi:predicted amidohydrolase